MRCDNVDTDRLNAFIEEARRTAVRFLEAADPLQASTTIVHHNDADGIAAAAALAYTLRTIQMDYRLLPIEKVHAPVVEAIHAGAKGAILYADLGGQSCQLIDRYTTDSQHVIILDHHLPGAAVSDHILHLNPEHDGISGDTDASGAAVCAFFAGELLKGASPRVQEREALPALMGVIGAVGDGQMTSGTLSGLNRLLLQTALKRDEVVFCLEDYAIPRYTNKSIEEIVDLLNLLGSVGFYAGHAKTGVDYLLGDESVEALRIAEELGELKATHFGKEAETIGRNGLSATVHLQWVDVRDRFAPMGVKAIGLFLEFLAKQGQAAMDKYLIGFQHLPAEMPGIGFIGGRLTKISARVPRPLRDRILEGQLPDLMTLIPQATDCVGGTADGCHRFAAASLIEQGREAAFLRALEDVLAGTR
jgi:hypothetical protein